MAKALILIDFINEIVDKDGKLAGKGYSDFIVKNNVFGNLNKLISYARANDYFIIFVKVGFSKNYIEQPKNSPLFGKANDFQVLKLDTWATDFHKSLNVREDDVVIIKHRVSSFYNTNLDLILKTNYVDDVLVAGVATDLAVSSVVREGHDRDYNMVIVEDCCVAATYEDHVNSLKILGKLAQIKKIIDLN